MHKKKRAGYVQFSKKMVIFVTAAVTAISLMSILLCSFSDGLQELQHIVEAFIGYATVCFAAYSGNSAVEKWLIRRYGGGQRNGEDEEESEDVG